MNFKTCLGFALFCVVTTVRADGFFCVSSGQELDDALVAARNLSNVHAEGSEIRLRRGSYSLKKIPDNGLAGDAPTSTAFRWLTIRGGYDPADATCADVGRIANPANTEITVTGVGDGDPFDGSAGFDLDGDLVVDAVTFATVRETNFLLYGNSSQQLRLSRNIFRSQQRRLLQIVTAPGKNGSYSWTIVNNLFTGAKATGIGQACVVHFDADPYNNNRNHTAQFTNNTIGGNNGSGVCLEKLVSARFDNNIIYGNTAGGIKADDTPIVMSNNLLQSIGNVLPNAQLFAEVSGDPMFVSSTDFHLRYLTPPSSPAINAGWSHPTVPAADLDGNDRTFGATKPDVGAYEAPVDPSPIIKVTTAADAGAGSLREAINGANNSSNTPQRIEFAIPNVTCPAVINLQSPLPDIADSLVVAGASQPGAVPNSATSGTNAKPCIAISGPGLSHAFRVPNVADQRSLAVDSMYFTGFNAAGNGAAIELLGGRGHRITGNHFVRLLPNAVAGVASSIGVRIYGSAYSARIGGDLLAERNLFAGSPVAGLVIGGDDNLVLNNVIGAGPTGGGGPNTSNATGIDLLETAEENVLSGNTISNNTGSGLRVGGSRNQFYGNLIGRTKYCPGAVCQPKLPNGTGVTVVAKAFGNVFRSNEVAYNQTAGFRLLDGSASNDVARNEVYLNGTQGVGGLGIDLGAIGINENDLDSTPAANAAANRSLNYPVLTAASGPAPMAGNPATGVVAGSLTSRNGNYTIDVYWDFAPDESGRAEMRLLVGSWKVSIDAPPDADGTVAFQIPVSANTLIGRYVHALARDSEGNTSELGPSVLFTQSAGNAAPSIEPQSFTISESAIPPVAIDKLVAADDGLLTDLAFSTPANPLFAVSQDGTLSLIGNLDYESVTLHTLDVTVVDKLGASDTATITVTVDDAAEGNEPPPTIAPQRFAVALDEKVEGGADPNGNGDGIGYQLAVPFGTVIATGVAPLSYQIVSGTNPKAFRIGALTAALELLQDLDFASASAYTLDVEVTDGNGSKSSATMTVVDDALRSDGFECKPGLPGC